VIKETSALTFMIAATFKEMLTVMAGVVVFGDTFGPLNGVGLLVLILGVMLFNCYKMDKMKAEAAEGIKAGARSSSGGGSSVLGTGEGSFISSMSPRAGERGGQVLGRRGGGSRGAGVSSSSNNSSPGGGLIAEDEEEGAGEGGEMAPLLVAAGSSTTAWSGLQRP
jgi:solute carrier family 35 protein C2